MQEIWFDPWAGKIPWRRKWQLAPVFLPGKSHGQNSLAGYCLLGCKELDMTEQVRARNPVYCFSFEVSLLCSPGKGISSPGRAGLGALWRGWSPYISQHLLHPPGSFTFTSRDKGAPARGRALQDTRGLAGVWGLRAVPQAVQFLCMLFSSSFIEIKLTYSAVYVYSTINSVFFFFFFAYENMYFMEQNII